MIGKIDLKDYRPDELEALHQIERSAAPLLAAGMSAEVVGELMIYAAYYLFAEAQGAGKQVDGWQMRTGERFLDAVTWFFTQTCGITIEVTERPSGGGDR